MIDLLSEDVSTRISALNSLSGWFDMTSSELADQVARIATVTDPYVRVREAVTWQESSATEYYRELPETWKGAERLELRWMRPPSDAGLLRRYRLSTALEDSSSATFTSRWIASAEHLLMEVELEGTLQRLSTVPVPLPERVIVAFRHLNPKEQRAILRRLVTTSSPVSIMHCLHLMACNASREPLMVRMARSLVKALLSAPANAISDAFLAVLRWVQKDFSAWPEMRALSPHQRLAMAWAHAGELFARFCAYGVNLKYVEGLFASAYGASIETFTPDPITWYDVAHPIRASFEALLISGLAYALGGNADLILDEPLSEKLRAEVSPTGMFTSSAVIGGLVRESSRSPNGSIHSSAAPVPNRLA